MASCGKGLWLRMTLESLPGGRVATIVASIGTTRSHGESLWLNPNSLDKLTCAGRDITNGREVALKLEHRSVVPSILEDEAEKCKQFQDLEGFPVVYWYGWHDDYKVMAFELLGPSLEDLFDMCGRKFSIKTVCMAAMQMVSATLLCSTAAKSTYMRAARY